MPVRKIEIKRKGVLGATTSSTAAQANKMTEESKAGESQ